jgi:RNA polymerase subunit RPABC4/transcription elongation factor Spt4
MIATVCKSCNTVSVRIIDRCKYCGSQQVETKFIDDTLIHYVGNGRQVYKEKKSKPFNK